jgi:hypothetical protein
MSITITKQSTDQKIEFCVHEHLSQVLITIYKNGERVRSGDLQLVSDFLALNKNADVPAGAYGIVAACCPISRATYDELQAAVVQVQAQLDADPTVKMQKLIDKRISLVEHYNILLTLKHEQHTQNIEDISAYGHTSKLQQNYDTDLASAEAAIKQFDATNPGVLVEIDRRKQESINNFLANN